MNGETYSIGRDIQSLIVELQNLSNRIEVIEQQLINERPSKVTER